MLTSTAKNDYNSDSSGALIPCWSTLETALNQLFPSPAEMTNQTILTSDDFLKLYTLVFEHCVGAVFDGKKAAAGSTGSGGQKNSHSAGGEELYAVLVEYLENRFNSWGQFIVQNNCNLDTLLAFLDKLQAAEKPLTFIFTYLERHWIDRQINELRPDILPMKQLIWSMWDELIFKNIWPHLILPQVSLILRSVRSHEIPLEGLSSIAKFVHYLRVISKPTQLESDYKATRKCVMAGAVINPRAIQLDRFKEFVQWYCNEIKIDAPRIDGSNVSDFVQIALHFWNEEEGRMSFLKFDKNAQIAVRNHLKELLLIPNMDKFRSSFRDSIIDWNVLEANAIYRLLANRKSLLVQLDLESEGAFTQKGKEIIRVAFMEANSIEDLERIFINSLGKFYNLSSELIQTSLASRPEIFESRSKAFRVLLNQPQREMSVLRNEKAGFSARCLAKFSDYLIRVFPESSEENLCVMSALFRLIDDKEEFQETYVKLLGIRLLTEMSHVPSKFEIDLLNDLKQICGAFYIKPFEKMVKDINEGEICNVTIITGGNWNFKGKLLPGHFLLVNPENGENGGSDDFKDGNSSHMWPRAISAEIIEKTNLYQQKYPKRKLFWSPILSSVEFQFTLNSGRLLRIRGNMLHLTVLEEITRNDYETNPFNDLIKKFGPNVNIILNSLLKIGLITREGKINEEFLSTESELVDLYALTLNEINLISTICVAGGVRTNNSTPSSFNTFNNAILHSPHTQTQTQTHSYLITTPIDKSILLQCSITRIMKQIRSLNLSDLFSRISMLPKLLSRFSPSLQDVLDALKQLHDKEFVQLVSGDGIDELIELSDGDLNNLSSFSQKYNLFIKYLA